MKHSGSPHAQVCGFASQQPTLIDRLSPTRGRRGLYGSLHSSWVCGLARLLVLLCCGLLGLSAQEPLPLLLQVDNPWQEVATSLPLRIQVQSQSDEQLHLQLHLRSDQLSLEKQLILAPHASELLWLALPPGYQSWDSLSLHISSRGYQGITRHVSTSSTENICIVDPALELPAQVTQALADLVADAIDSRHRYYHTNRPEARRLSVDLLPSQSLWYPWDLHLLFTRAGWQELRPSQRQAILSWSRRGGQLLTLDSQLFSEWQQEGFFAILVGRGDPQELYQAVENSSMQALQDIQLASPQQAYVSQESLPSHLHARNSYRLNLGIEKEGPDWSLPGTEERGRGIMGAMVLLFFLFAGPGALWWSRRQGRPTRLLLFAPLLGLMAFVLIIGSDMIILGVSRDSSLVEMSVLDLQQQQVLVGHGIASFGGFALRRMQVPEAARLIDPRQVNIVDDWYSRHRVRTAPGSLSLRHDQQGLHARGELLPARNTGHLALLQSLPERRRIRVFSSQGEWWIENDLGVPIERVFWYDHHGRWRQAEHIASGSRGVLELSQQRPEAEDGLASRLPREVIAPWQTHRPGQLYAYLAEALQPLPLQLGRIRSPQQSLLTAFISPEFVEEAAR